MTMIIVVITTNPAPADEDRSALLNTPSSVPPLCSNQGLLSLLFIEPMSLTEEEKVESHLPLLSASKKTEINLIYWTLPHGWLLSRLLMRAHIHTHTNLSDTSLALFCWPFIAHAIWQVRRTQCGCVCVQICVCVSRLWGQRGVIGG